MTPQIIETTFWASLVLIAYTYPGYPALMFCLAKIFPQRSEIKNAATSPSVTAVLVACNEENKILARLQNLLASDYPKDKLNVIVVSDGSTDSTEKIFAALNEPRVRLISNPHRSGKAHCINLALAVAHAEIIVFCDTRQRFEPETIARLAGHFSDPKIGAVSGALEIEPSTSGVGSGVDAYWKLEKFLRHAESRFDSSIGCTGAVYAIRREFFRPLPPETLLDDVVIPMQIVEQGFRVAFDPTAVAFDPQTLEPDREKIRKRRTLAGNYQMLFKNWRWLFPWRNRLWWMLISHKYLRLAAPFFMLLALVTNFFLIGQNIYKIMFLGQCLFYLAAIFGLLFSSKRLRLFSIPAGFVFLNCMVVTGLWHYFSQPKPAWEKSNV